MNVQSPRKIKNIYVGNIAYKVINGFTERINYERLFKTGNTRR